LQALSFRLDLQASSSSASAIATDLWRASQSAQPSLTCRFRCPAQHKRRKTRSPGSPGLTFHLCRPMRETIFRRKQRTSQEITAVMILPKACEHPARLTSLPHRKAHRIDDAWPACQGQVRECGSPTYGLADRLLLRNQAAPRKRLSPRAASLALRTIKRTAPGLARDEDSQDFGGRRQNC
jgi:hypothetical protein